MKFSPPPLPPADSSWSKPRPLLTPRPTYWPALLAFGITFLLWGLITSPVLLIAGGGFFVVSLAGWIGEIAHARQE